MWEGEIGILESLRTGREWWVMREPVSKKLDWQLRLPSDRHMCLEEKNSLSQTPNQVWVCNNIFGHIQCQWIYCFQHLTQCKYTLSDFYIADLKINGEVWDPLDTDKWNGREGPVSALWQFEGRSRVHGTPNNGSGRDVLKDRNRKVLLFDLIGLCLILFCFYNNILNPESCIKNRVLFRRTRCQPLVRASLCIMTYCETLCAEMDQIWQFSFPSS